MGAAYEGLVVRLEGGLSGRRELHLDGGRPHSPFAVGENGDWKVLTGRVGAHVMIAYNGREVYVATVGVTDGVEINGHAAPHMWTLPALPAVVSFGGARLVIDEEVDTDDGNATSIADEARLKEAIESSRLADTSLQSPMACTGLPISKPRVRMPPPLPTRPPIRIVTKPWDKS